MPQLRVKDYAQVFLLREAFRHPEVSWTKWPVSRAGLTFRTLMASTEGQTAFCVFNGIIRLVSRYKTEGMLSIAGRDMTPADVSVDSGIPLPMADAGWKLLQHHGWLEPVPDRSETGEAPAIERRGTVAPPAPRQEERRVRNSASAASEPLYPSDAGASDGERGGGGLALSEGQEKARRALVALGVRPSKIVALVAAHEPDAIHEGIRLAKETTDDRPKAGLAVSLIESGDAASSLVDKKEKAAASLGASVMRLMKPQDPGHKRRVVAWAEEYQPGGVTDEVIREQGFLRWLGQREDAKQIWRAATGKP